MSAEIVGRKRLLVRACVRAAALIVSVSFSVGSVAQSAPVGTQAAVVSEAEQLVAKGNALGKSQSKDDRLAAIQAYEGALPLFRSEGNKPGEAATLRTLGSTERSIGQSQKAVAHYEQALAVYRDLKERSAEAYVLNAIGLTYGNSGAYDKAVGYYEQALAIRRELKERSGEAVELYNLTVNYVALKQYDKGVHSGEQAVAINRDLNNTRSEADSLEALASALMGSQRDTEAIEIYERLLAIHRELKESEEERKVLSILSDVLDQAGNQDRAIQYRLELIKMLATANDLKGSADALMGLGADYYALKQYDRALQSFQLAAESGREMKDEVAEKNSLFQIARAYMRLGQPDKAIVISDQVFAFWHQFGPTISDWQLGFTDIAYFALIRPEEALEYCTDALSYVREQKDRKREAEFLMHAGFVYTTQTDRKAKKYLEDALSLSREINDRDTEAGALINLARVAQGDLRFEDAAQLLKQALAIFAALGDNNVQAALLMKLGETYVSSGQYEKGLSSYTQALAIRHESKNERGEIEAILEVGNSQGKLRHNEKAIEVYQQALRLQQQLKLREDEGTTLLAIGRAYWRMGQDNLVRELRQQAFAIFHELNKRPSYSGLWELGGMLHQGRYEEFLEIQDENVAIALEWNDRVLGPRFLHSLAVGYARLNTRDKALLYLDKALAWNREAHNRDSEARDLDDIGYVYANTGDPSKALEYHAQSLAIGVELKSDRIQGLALNNIGAAHRRLGHFQQAVEFGEKALPLLRKDNREMEALNLYNLGGTYRGVGQFDKSMQALQQALKVFRDYENPHGIGAILTEMMFTSKAQGHPALAIIYGKQAINEFQTIRGRIVSIDAGTQKDFVRNFAEDTYRILADLLVSQGRLPEAQHVLGLLKQREYFDFIRRDGSASDAMNGRTTLTEKEAKAEKAFREVSERVTAVGAEWDKLREKQERTPEEDARFHQLDEKLTAAQHEFSEYLDRISRELQSGAHAVDKAAELKELANSQSLMTDLDELGPGTIALYTLVGADKLRIMVVTPQVQVAREYPITAADLARKVQAFREVLQEPTHDPRPLAQELYRIVLAPVEKDLEGAKAKTLMWSLDGVLRYLPLAALHDGRGWLMERYRNVIFTVSSHSRLKDVPNPQWNALALGVSRQVGDFPALPAVRDEIQWIVRDPRAGTRGVLPGDIRLDQSFTKSVMLDALKGGRHPVIHIASHFNFRPGTEIDSYLLLGDGGQFKLSELRDQHGLFRGVDLLTLSACNTAMGGTGEEGGREIEGFGLLAQMQGAKAVMATLWPVADESTGMLMREFYRVRQEHPSVPKIEALRQAQMSLATGTLSKRAGSVAGRDASQRGVAAVRTGGRSLQGTRFETDPRAPYAHPYFWAPFILIGNWR